MRKGGWPTAVPIRAARWWRLTFANIPDLLHSGALLLTLEAVQGQELNEKAEGAPGV